jgi:hypothetical protein
MKVFLGFASIVLASSAAFSQQAEPTPRAGGATRGVASTVRFATTTELPAPGGQAQRYRLALGDIKVSGSKRVQVPPNGFYIATLVTNDVVSVTGDRRVLRHTGDSWAVPAGQPLVLEPQGKNHTVLLDVFQVEPNPTR